MNIKKTLTTIGIAGALAIGGGTAVMAAGSASGSSTGDATGVRGTFVCGHLDEINTQLSGRHQLLEGRLTLLTEARTAAEGHDQVIAKIDVKIAKTNAAITKNEAHTAKLATWAPEHCDATAATPAG
jgi:hypothetical protein